MVRASRAAQQALLSTAAKLIVADGLTSGRALERAAAMLGVRLADCRPDREQLNQAIDDYRTLFRPEQTDAIAERRRAAVALMRALIRYRPRAAGALVDGSDALGDALLFVEADSTEVLMHDLFDRRVPWRAVEYRARHSSGRRITHPALQIETTDLVVTLVVLSGNIRSDPPRDPLDGKPLKLLDADALEALISAS